MSFNFSDSEAEDEFDLAEFDETGLLAQEESSRRSPTREEEIVPTNPIKSDAEPDASEVGDWDNVDWEDAIDDEEDDEDEEFEHALPSLPQEGITIQIGKSVGIGRSNNPDDFVEEKKNKEAAIQDKPDKKKPRKSTVRVLRNVHPETQQLVLSIRRSHLLCCMIHSMQCSSLCSSYDSSLENETTELFYVALSLIPQEFHTESTTKMKTSFVIPNTSTVKQFSDWFVPFVNDAGQRRRRAMGRNAAQGATTPSARKRRRSNERIRSLSGQTPSTSTLLQRLRHLSPCYDEEPQLFLELEGLDPIDAVESISSQEKVLLFLIMVRSLGWRARYITSLPAIPLKLTVDHPLFKSFPSTASSEANMSTNQLKDNVTNGKKQKKSKRQQKSKSKHGGDAIDLVDSGEEEDVPKGLLSWVEVLCEKIGREKAPGKVTAQWTPILLEQKSIGQPELVENVLAWMEVKTKCKKGSKLDRSNAHRAPKKSPVSYVLAVEHEQAGNQARFTDVTRRYANTWAKTLSLRGATSKDIKERRGECVDEWFKASLKRLNNHFKGTPTKQEAKPLVRSVTKLKGGNGKLIDVLELESSDDEDRKPAAKRPDDDDDIEKDDHVIDEKEELKNNSAKEVIPKSKAAFKNHPFYVIPSVLNSKEVLHPDARKRICGVFKGELVYRRSDVSTALKAKKWLYVGREVKDSELQKPAKKVKARKKPKKKGFQALESYGISESAQDEAIASLEEKKDSDEDEMESLYGIWQTEVWSPPYVSPSDPIPTNEYKNVEKELLNPGLTHLEQPRLAGIARKLGVPYAPCMIGFERHGGRGTPSIRGIVVHDHNATLIREASIEWDGHVAEKERSDRRKEVLKKWKRLVVGVLTKERLDREYGSH